MIEKPISVSIYRDGPASPCNWFRDVNKILLCPDYETAALEQSKNPDAKIGYIRCRVLNSYRGEAGPRPYYDIQPYPFRPGSGMFGGDFAYSSDSRFGFDYPLPIHDRHE